MNQDWVKAAQHREQRLLSIQKELAKGRDGAKPQWYLNSQGQTLVVFPGPVEFMMGSPPGEIGRNPNEARQRRRIGRTFAIANKPVTVEQFQQFVRKVYEKDPEYFQRAAPTVDCPMNGTSWYQAAEYCNWLSA